MAFATRFSASGQEWLQSCASISLEVEKASENSSCDGRCQRDNCDTRFFALLPRGFRSVNATSSRHSSENGPLGLWFRHR